MLTETNTLPRPFAPLEAPLRTRTQLPRRRLYPLLGLLLAMGAPAGLLLVRSLSEGASLTLEWAFQELTRERLLYGYLALSTSIVFLALGYFLGLKEDELRAVSLVDPLTGLFNRRYLAERLRKESTRFKREGTPYSVLIIDLDHFKHINDKLGHDVGDQALRNVARLIRETIRSNDVAVRYGGDEFVLLLPATHEGGALQLAGRLQERLALLAKDKEAAPPLSLSIGVAALKEGAQANAEELLRVADQALYRAKAEGGGRVSFAAEASTPSSQGETFSVPRHIP